MFPTLSGDFFPYSDHNEEYWTGYFTTRPFLKSLGRDVEVYLKSADILNTLATMHCSNISSDRSFEYVKNSSFYRLATARQHLGLFQHHDAITGTARSWVAIDYEDRLHQALQIIKIVMKDSMIFLLSISSIELRIPEINIRVMDPPSSYTLTPTESVIHIPAVGCKILLFNSLAQSRNELIRFIIDRHDVAVLDRFGTKVITQIGPVWNVLGKKKLDIFEIAFMAELSAMAFTSFNIIAVDEKPGLNVNVIEYGSELSLYQNEQIIIENDFIQAKISAFNGQLLALNQKKNILKLKLPKQNKLNLKLLTYTSRRSGAYIFAPSGPATNEHFKTARLSRVITGPVFSEAVIYHSSVTQILRIVNCSCILATVLEVNNIVDIQHLDDRELIMRFNSAIQNADVFYTDQNGYQTVERKQFSNFVLEANYYPSTSIVYIEDLKSRLTIIHSQPVGVSSLGQGSIEIMLDRRLKYDDGRGLGEGILDNRRVLSRFYVIFEHHEQQEEAPVLESSKVLSVPSRTAMILADRLRDFPIISISNYPINKFPIFSPLRAPLPCDTILVNLRMLGSSFPKHSAALIIHRRSYVSLDQASDVGNLECSIISDEKFELIPDDMFKDVSVRKVTLTSLSLINNIQQLEPDQSFPLAANRLYTFKFLYL